jgi:hypothetical protein
MMACTYNLSYTRKQIQEDYSPGWPGHECEALFEISIAIKRARGVAHAAECLPGKSKDPVPPIIY